MSDPFLWVKWLHILGATVLFGTGLGTAFHHWMSHRSGEPEAIAVATRNTVLADGIFTGKVVEPVCFEEGKIHWLQQFIADHEIDLAKSWFYTDSVTDLPLLDLVGHPVCVNPDPRLYRHAVHRRWPVRVFAAPRRTQEGADTRVPARPPQRDG